MEQPPIRDWEDPDPEDQDSFDDDNDTPTTECAKCHREIHADTEWCPHCGQFVMKEERHFPLLWIAIVVLVLIAAVWIIR